MENRACIGAEIRELPTVMGAGSMSSCTSELNVFMRHVYVLNNNIYFFHYQFHSYVSNYILYQASSVAKVQIAESIV